jgi:hypothetical protein
MKGLELTFETLAKSRNEAALDVLVAALGDPDSQIRNQGVQALLCREERRAPTMLLAHWSKLEAEDLALLRARPTWIRAAVDDALGHRSAFCKQALAAAESLHLTDVLPTLISLAESAIPRSFRLRASEVVQNIITPLGENARANRDQSTIRGPAISRLAESVRQFDLHRNAHLVEAFLSASNWCDPELRHFLSQAGQEADLLCQQLSESTNPSVMQLLAGFLRRRNVHDRILELIRSRNDPSFRSTLLRTIGGDPTQTVLRNLEQMGMPKCCQGGEALLRELSGDCQSALIHVHVACNPDYVATLHLVAAAIESGTQECLTAATIALSRCEVPNARSWMRAALHVAEEDPSRPIRDETVRLLRRLMGLLKHPDVNLVRSVRRVLAVLHAGEMLPHFQSLRVRSRRRLGRVVMKIDPDATLRVRDALRHPVLNKRLEAIAMADALGAVDELSDLFAHIAREDHMEARMRAAEAMAEASSDETLRLLEEMVQLPQGPVRDAAIVALQQRQHSSAAATSPADWRTPVADRRQGAASC